MDDQVLAAMKRWPDVPDVFGWLRLDRRGRWRLIDRNQPDFDPQTHGQGSPITNTQILDFIARNYLRADDGCWYWQNGPQRAFVELDLAPWIYRVMQTPASESAQRQSLLTHTGEPCRSVECWQMDADGVLYVLTEHGPGAVHDLDLSVLRLELHESTAGEMTGTLDWNGQSMTLGPVDQRMTDFVKSPLMKVAV